MTFNLEADVVVRAGRTAERVAADLRRAGAVIEFGPTEVADGEALARLRRRVHRLASRIGSNGRALQDLVRDADAVDRRVSLSFTVLAGRWR
jgi:hypothetical protein